jgi:hypothetical protein
VPPRNHELLADAIVILLDTPKERHESIRRQICDHLSIEKLVARTEHVLTSLLHNTPVNVTAVGSVTIP